VNSSEARVLAAISVGGVLGALVRYGLGVWFPHALWTTLVINATGCLLIGVLMVVIEGAHPLVRPFLGVGVLGGYTTFSTYVVDVLRAGSPVTALVYLFGTLALAVAAVWTGTALTRRVLR